MIWAKARAASNRPLRWNGQHRPGIMKGGPEEAPVRTQRLRVDQCKTCHRTMSLGLFVYSCEWCSADFPNELILYRGFIMRIPGATLPEDGVYVFRTEADVARYIVAIGPRYPEATCERVLSTRRFNWIMSRGTLRDIILSPDLYTIYPDHRFPADPNTAWLSPVKK